MNVVHSLIEAAIAELHFKYNDFCWEISDKKQRKTYETELKRELTPEHALYSKGAFLQAFAYSERADDVLFYDGIDCFLVHLTWGQSDAVYPKYEKVDLMRIDAFLENYYLG